MSLDYLLIGVVVAYVAWRLLGAIRVRRRLPELKREGAQLVDVRSVGEYAGGHVPGTLNIPLQEIDARARELDPSRWVVVACASGTRSALAARKLKALGFQKVMNAGSWRNLG
jgi:rhodanese-related sulfurtransferase